jgi:1,4-dihydroxy-2-naphthoate octaprenyltransferase
MTSDTSTLTPLQIWLLAIRPKTLPAAASPVIVGSAVALVDNAFHWGPALATLAASLLLQIGANLANDVFDYHRGADTTARLGPLRVTQAGLLSPTQVLTGMWLCFGLAALLGVYLTWVAGWPVLVMGLSAILTAIVYTGGPFPLGYYGLGDLAVFIFFGLVATCGTFFIQARYINLLAIWSALPMGFLITAILAVNNLRDIATDKAAGKRTLAVRMGGAWTRKEYVICLGAAFLVPPYLGGLQPSYWWTLLTFLALPYAIYLGRFVWHQTGRPLNQALAGTGRLTLIFALLFAGGLILSVFFA